MTVKAEIEEIEAIMRRTLRNLRGFAGIKGRSGSLLRFAAGDLAANTGRYLIDGTFGNRLWSCFRIATEAGISLDWMDVVMKGLVEEKPTALSSTIVVQNSLLLALAQEGRIIRATTYVSRDDVDTTMRRMKAWFDTMKELIADTMSGPGYESFMTLAAGITRYLTDIARPLPRIITYEMAKPMPALAISQFIYGDGGRSDEIIAENKVVHPAFVLREVRALSA